MQDIGNLLKQPSSASVLHCARNGPVRSKIMARQKFVRFCIVMGILKLKKNFGHSWWVFAKNFFWKFSFEKKHAKWYQGKSFSGIFLASVCPLEYKNGQIFDWPFFRTSRVHFKHSEMSNAVGHFQEIKDLSSHFWKWLCPLGPLSSRG